MELSFGKITKGGNTFEQQKKKTINILHQYYNAWEVIQLIDDYATLASEVKHRAMKEEGIKQHLKLEQWKG